MDAFIKAKLMTAYKWLGVETPEEQARFVSQGLAYLKQDRERYIEVAEPGTPEHKISYAHGVICRLIPLGRQISQAQKVNCISRKTNVLALMVTKDRIRYVIMRTWDLLFASPAITGYGHPVCYFTRLEDLKEPLLPVQPQEVTPLATVRERRIVSLVFLAISICATEKHSPFILRTTERAMQAMVHLDEESILLDGQQITGKLLPLAAQHRAFEERFRDHSYSCTRQLCLLAAQDRLHYVLKTCQTYQAFPEGSSGGQVCEPPEERHLISYIKIPPEEIPENFLPYPYE